MHICARRQVSNNLFHLIIDKLSSENCLDLLQTPDSDGNLPLHVVARTSEKDSYICKEMLNKIKQIENMHVSASTRRGNNKKLSMLDHLSVKNRLGKTAAHEASQQGHLEILQFMWNKISLDDQKTRQKGFFLYDHDMFSCLHLAAMNGDDQGKQFYIS